MKLSEILESRPRQAVAFERLEDGRVVLIRPKILNPRWKWLLRLLGKPDYKVRLDARGSFIWERLDGTRTVREIDAELVAAFPEGSEDSEGRTGRWVHELVRGKFVGLG